MLDEKQIQVIEKMCTGDYTVAEAMESVGLHRTTYYKWVKDKEFLAEMNKRLQEIKTQAEKDFVSYLPKAIAEYKKICSSSTDVRTKEKALANWIDRALGRIANTVNINDDRQDNDVDILAAIDEYNDDEDNNSNDKIAI